MLDDILSSIPGLTKKGGKQVDGVVPVRKKAKLSTAVGEGDGKVKAKAKSSGGMGERSRRWTC